MCPIYASVIIPVYNVEKYLIECLDSVVNQTLKSIEIICINDGSTDNSLKILQKYALKYKNIVLISQENRGAGAARNKALKIANGEYVAFMDADDYYPSMDILECLYNSAKENKVLISGGSLNTLKDECISTKGFGKKFSFYCNRKVKYEDYQFAYGFTRFIYHLEMLRKNNVCFPEYMSYEDPIFLVKAMCAAGEFYGMEKITYRYRIGIKKINWTSEKIRDTMKGILDLLHMSRKLEMSTLHTNIAEGIQSHLIPILTNLARGHFQIIELAQQINHVMDRELLKKENRDIEKYYLPSSHEAVKMLEEIQEKENLFVEQLQAFNEIVIYGAGYIGTKVAEYIKNLQGTNIVCFAVTKGKENPDTISGIPVKTINELVLNKEKVLVIIATLDNFQQDIKNTLELLNFKNVIPINFREFQFYRLNN